MSLLMVRRDEVKNRTQGCHGNRTAELNASTENSLSQTDPSQNMRPYLEFTRVLP